MKRFLFIILLATPFLGKASHIVGGELALVHIPGTLYRYRVEMILYYDVHGNTGGDLNALVRIFSKRTNLKLRDVNLSAEGPINNTNPQNIFAIGTEVEYFQPECSDGSIETNRVLYKSSEFDFNPSIFNDPEGYYMVYERCCRNYTITNIYSDPPGPGSDYDKIAGQIFYLEFPPVVKDGVPFINSSPQLFPPLSDYGCPGRFYFVDFAGTDIDGDSLSYSLSTPLNSIERIAALPSGGPNAGPYQYVTWKPGYSYNNFMNGNPDLHIDEDGMLSVTPGQSGLFVFAVRCEEFRNGVKIGEVRRDFQMLVQKSCPTAVPPKIVGRIVGDPTFTYSDVMNITFPYDTPDNKRCIEVQVSDQDINNIFDGFKEKITILKKGKTNALGKVSLPVKYKETLTLSNPTATFQICLDDCPIKRNVPYKFNIIVLDDACPLPYSDTLRVSVTIVSPDPNKKPEFIFPDHKVVNSVFEGTTASWPVKVVDDLDPIVLSYSTDGFDLLDVGMDFDYAQPDPKIINDTLIWEASCNKYDFSTKQNFRITMLADDLDFCNFNPPDTAYFNLTLINPSADPTIDTDITAALNERQVDYGSVKIYDQVSFKVTGMDADPYDISLQALGIGFQPIDYKMAFPEVSGKNIIESTYTWPIECIDLDDKNNFKVRFLVIDRNNKCLIYQADTVDVAIKVLPPINNPPEITAVNLHPETETGLNTSTTFWNQTIEFLLTGTDVFESPVEDQIKLELAGATGNITPVGYSFNAATGQSEISTKFIWTPNCSIFTENDTLNTYQFKFRVFDNHCESADTANVILNINIKDYKSTDRYFDPASIITPNSDQYNDYFSLDGYELRENGTNPNDEVALPLDNCLNRFEYINIYNRWGKLVFTSDNRFFRWYAPNAAAGVYYYFVKFTNKDYKGSVTVRY